MSFFLFSPASHLNPFVLPPGPLVLSEAALLSPVHFFPTSPIVRGLDLQYAKYSLLLSFLSLYDPIPKENALFHLTDAFLPFLVDNYRAGIANPNACRSQKDILSGDDGAEIMENWSDALSKGATATELRLTLTMEKWDPNIARSFDFSEDLEIQILCWNFPTVKCCQLTQ